jgi:hypothetical protein
VLSILGTSRHPVKYPQISAEAKNGSFVRGDLPGAVVYENGGSKAGRECADEKNGDCQEIRRGERSNNKKLEDLSANGVRVFLSTH